MIPLLSGQDIYYKKMLELQEKLRKSEEERIRLEERFSLMEQESRMRHEACINKLRMRYIEFLEEQRLRDERNHKLLGALDKVDTSLALMSAKTDKLYTLKREYEASILRAHANQRHANSVAGDSGVISQNDERLMLIKDTQSSPQIPTEVQYNFNQGLKTPRSLKDSSLVGHQNYSSINIPRKAFNQALPATSQILSKPLPARNELLFHDRLMSSIDYRRNFEPKFTRQTKSSTWNDEHSIDFDKFVKRDLRKNLVAKESSAFRYLDPPDKFPNTKLTDLLSSVSKNVRQENSIRAAENELEKYINKIQTLHNNYDQSLDDADHEQNTSGDLLNVSLSDDGFDHLPVEEKKQKEQAVNVPIIINSSAPKIVEKSKPAKSDPALKIIEPIILPQSHIIHPENFATDARISTNTLPKIQQTVVEEESAVEENIAAQKLALERSIENANIVDESKYIDVEQSSVDLKNNEPILTADLNNELPLKPNIPEDVVSNEHKKNAQENLETTEILSEDLGQLEQQVEQVFIDKTGDLHTFDQNVFQETTGNATVGDGLIENQNNTQEILNEENYQVLAEVNPDAGNLNIATEAANKERSDANEANFVDQNNYPEGQNGQVYEYPEGLNEQNVNVNQNYEEYQQEQQYGQSENNQEFQYDQQPQQQYPEEVAENYQYNQDGEYAEYPSDLNAQYQDPNYVYQEEQQYAVDSEHQQYVEDPNQQYIQDPNQVYQADAYMQDTNQTYDTADAYDYANQDQAYVDPSAYEGQQGYTTEDPNQGYQEQENVLEEGSGVKDENVIQLQLAENRSEENVQKDVENDEKRIDDNLNGIDENVNELKKSKDESQVGIKEMSDTDSTMEINASNTESDFDFN